MSRRWAAWLLLATMAFPLGLSAVWFVHTLADHHGADHPLGQVGQALAHGHWHELGTEDHDHLPSDPPVPRDFRELQTTGDSAAPRVGDAVAVRAPDLATEFRPPRPAGADLLHHLSLLRI
ncbi:MAG: hypothetical protein SF066_22015 [Thermoanaerobaculia bacterium]|nr:hypothetical protein [Thermoanaerobaculia bacterium]